MSTEDKKTVNGGEQKPLSQDMEGICAICGADYGLHHFGSMLCPKFGREARFDEKQEWDDTQFVNRDWQRQVDRLPELLKAEQERNYWMRRCEDSEDTLRAKISELEETIAAKDAKLEVVLKGLREIEDLTNQLGFSPDGRLRRYVIDLLNTANKS